LNFNLTKLKYKKSKKMTKLQIYISFEEKIFSKNPTVKF